MEVPDHYAVLGITREATARQIKAARTNLLQNLADKANVDDAEKYRSVQLSFDVLSSAKARRQYDRLLNQGPSPGPWSQTVASTASHASESMPISSSVSADSSVPLSSLDRPYLENWAENLQPPDWNSHGLWRSAHMKITQAEVTQTHQQHPPIPLNDPDGIKIPLWLLLQRHLHLTCTDANSLSTLLMTAEKGTLIRVPVVYPRGHPMFAAAQMEDDGRRVLHGTSFRGGLAIVSSGFNGSKVGPGKKTLKSKFAANGDWPDDAHLPFAVYSTTLPHTAENYEWMASKFYPNECLLPDTPKIVARVAAQLKPNSLLVRVTPTKGANGKPKNEQLLTLSKDTIPRELVLRVIELTDSCATRNVKIRGAKSYSRRVAQAKRAFLQPERHVPPPGIDFKRHVNATARKRYWRQQKRMREIGRKDADENSEGATKISRKA